MALAWLYGTLRESYVQDSRYSNDRERKLARHIFEIYFELHSARV